VEVEVEVDPVDHRGCEDADEHRATAARDFTVRAVVEEHGCRERPTRLS